MEIILKVIKDRLEIINKDFKELIDKLEKGKWMSLDKLTEFMRLLRLRYDLNQSLFRAIKKEEKLIKESFKIVKKRIVKLRKEND